MAQCSVCGEALAPGSWTCSLCGTTMAQPVAANVEWQPPVQPALPMGEVLAPGTRLCPGCGQTYGPDYGDTFCTCGMELFQASQLPVALIEEAPSQELSTLPAAPAAAEHNVARPPAGTKCLVLYGPDRRPLQYFPLDKDALLIGRLDAVAGIFPDIDVTEWLDAALARKVSRKHALILRSRATGAYVLRPLVGNTGTQLEADLVAPLHDCLLANGCRLILGGAVRLKFEIT